jgi:hypothetical protein
MCTTAVLKQVTCIKRLLDQVTNALHSKRQHFVARRDDVHALNRKQLDPVLTLDIGGQGFKVLFNTLQQDETTDDNAICFLAEWMGLSEAIFFDRDPTFFASVLQFMRSNSSTRIRLLPQAPAARKRLHREARFYNTIPLLLATSVSWPDTTLVLVHYIRDAGKILVPVSSRYQYRPQVQCDKRGIPFRLKLRPLDATSGQGLYFVVTESSLGRHQVWYTTDGREKLQKAFFLPFASGSTVGRRLAVGTDCQLFVVGHPARYHNRHTNTWRYKKNGTQWRVNPLPSVDCVHPYMEICAGEDRIFLVAGYRALELTYPYGEWNTLPEPPISMRFVSVVFWNEEFFCIGGQDDEGPTRCFIKWSPRSRRWTRLPDLLHARWRCSVRIVSDAVVMVFGGGSMTVEAFVGTQWIILPPLHLFPALHCIISSNSIF